MIGKQKAEAGGWDLEPATGENRSPLHDISYHWKTMTSIKSMTQQDNDGGSVRNIITHLSDRQYDVHIPTCFAFEPEFENLSKFIALYFA